jgi:hypothetical protein
MLSEFLGRLFHNPAGHAVVANFEAARANLYLFIEPISNITYEIYQRQLTKERLVLITVIAIGCIGLSKSIDIKSPVASILFTGVIILGTGALVMTHDYTFIQRELEHARIELRSKQALMDELRASAIRVRELTTLIGPLEHRLRIFEESHADVTRVVEMLVTTRLENQRLRTELEERVEQLQAATLSLTDAANRIDQTSLTSHLAVANLNHVSVQILDMTNRLEEIATPIIDRTRF